MKIRSVLIASILLIVLMGFGLSPRAQAAPVQQQFATSTPLPDGQVFYIVKPNDYCDQIAFLNNVTAAQLREMNPTLNQDCSNLQIGQKLLIALSAGAAASATPGPAPTQVPPTITPTAFAGTTEICVLLYDDINGDGLREANEPAIAGGAISVSETSGKFSKTLQTAINPDPNAFPGVCFTDVPEGNYNLGAAIPDNYNATTKLTDTFDVKAGDVAQVSFGAQSRDTTAAQPAGGNQPSGPSPLIGFFGGFLLLGGLGLGYYALRLRNPQSKLKRSGLLRR